jgi:hypothetical protein
MKMISASLVLFALFVTESAFAGCGSHAVYRSRPAKVSVVVKKIVKREPISNVRTAAATTADKPAPTLQASTVNTSTESSPAKTVQSAAALECKEYSATIGGMITVPCS